MDPEPAWSCRDKAVLSLVGGLCFLLAAVLHEGMSLAVFLAYTSSALWTVVGFRQLRKAARGSEPV